MLQNGGKQADLLDVKRMLDLVEKTDPSSALYRRCREFLETHIEVGTSIPRPTPQRERKFLTIGIPTYDDYDGCYFSIQAIRFYHPEILPDVEFLVIDNNPTGPGANALKALDSYISNYRYIPYRSAGLHTVKDLIFRLATGEFVLCMDSHVFFPAGVLARLIAYCRQNPASNDLWQGPVLNDNLQPLSTHLEQKWWCGISGNNWAMDERGKDPESAPFDIDLHGLGMFSCRRQAWPGLNPRLSGFGGEEGYLHEKFRRAGSRTLCLPFLRWMHRFDRPLGIPYKRDWEDWARNYLLIHHELGMDPRPMIEHYESHFGKERTGRIVDAFQGEISSPFHFFDAIYCINLDRQTDRWEAMQRRFQKLGIARRVRRFAAVETPANHQIGCALSHRRVIAEAKQQGLQNVLVLEDDARFTPDASMVLEQSLQELEGREWQLLYLGGYTLAGWLTEVPGCKHLEIPNRVTCLHAIACHHSVYDAILEAVPDTPLEASHWLGTHLGIDQFYAFGLQAKSFITCPVIATQDSILPIETRVFDG